MRLLHPVAQTLVVPVTASHATIGASFSLLPYERLAIIAKLVSVDTSTLDIYLQDSWDGVKWYDCAHFTQLTAAAPTLYERVSIIDLPDPAAHMAFLSVGAPGTVNTDATHTIPANTYLPLPWGPNLRIVSLTGAGTNGSPSTQTFDFLLSQVYQ